MKTVVANREGILKACKILKDGGLVAFPTETVYGLGADAFSSESVKRIYQIKERSPRNPLIIHLADSSELLRVSAPNSRQQDQLNRLAPLWPGPLTVVLPKNKKLGVEVCAGLPTVAVRIPSHPVAQSLLKESGLAIAAPSANRSLYISPTTAEHVADDLGDQLDLILDGGPSTIGLESTILSLVEECPTILRPGSITQSEIENLLNEVVNLDPPNASDLKAPGMMAVHYSPTTPLYFIEELKQTSLLEQKNQRWGFISFAGDIPQSENIVITEQLSLTGDSSEIATGLYGALRKFDKLHLDMILIDSCKQEGLGLAVMNRLLKAVHSRVGKA